MQQISDYELELMKIIWGNGGTSMYADIFSALEAKGTPWTKNTIITLLSRLIDKGLLEISKTGRRNIYTAIVSENKYQADQTTRFINKIFEGNTTGLVSALIENNFLSPSDYAELEKHWKEGDKTP